MKIICVNGYARSGKDTFCEYAFVNRGLVYNHSTIDIVKKIAVDIGWDGVKDEKGRKFLSDLKDCLTEYNDLPTQCVLRQIRTKLSIVLDEENHDDTIFLVQMREPEEIKRWKEDYGARALLIQRPSFGGDWGNHADDDVLLGEYDYKLDNNGSLKEWEDKTIEFIDMIRKENWESHV